MLLFVLQAELMALKVRPYYQLTRDWASVL